MKKLQIPFITTFLILFLSVAAISQNVYQMPPAEVAALVDAPSSPNLIISPNRDVMILLHSPGVKSIEDLAQPELRLGGSRINPRNNGPSRANYSNRITIKNISDLTERTVSGLPNNAQVLNLSFSPDGKTLAFILTQNRHLELWTASVENASAKKLGNFSVNNTWFGSPYDWFPDGSKLLVRTVPANRGDEPVAKLAPLGPNIQASTGEAAPARTFQDLLSNPHDEALFDYYFTSQLMIVNLDGTAQPYSTPEIFAGSSVSPDGNYILLSRIERPYSYVVPASRFPISTEVWNTDGQLVSIVQKLPVLDNIPTAFNSTHEGRRSISWRADAPATLFFVETQDGGIPSNQIEVRDIAYLLNAPFEAEPVVIAKLSNRYAGIAWGNDNFAIISETWRATRNTKTWRIRPGNPLAQAEILFDRSYEDRYNDPGTPVMRMNQYGRSVMHTIAGGSAVLMTGTGASPDGNRPFLRAFELSTKEFHEIWRSEAPYLESVAAIVNDSGTKFITRRESNTEPANFFERDAERNSSRGLTEFPHPTPQLIGVQSEFVTYNREDGLPLTGQLLLPPGYDAERDGPLPLMLWAYPREFASADAAGQVSDSPHRFNAISYWGPHFLVTQGYAVLNNAAMPIVAPAPNIEPNDNFLEQLIGNAKAAIDYLAERGIADPNRVAVGGHSYGAFMTANLLAHSDLFKAGIARSGAYNRSLTPFGFQAEPRSIWEARETYITMSPFFYAHQIKTPILFIHGEADNNSGTFPIQSERMFQAVRGTGGTTKLVMLPHESHGYQARESLMHMLWETIEWLDTYVK